MATAAKFRIDFAIHDLLMNSAGGHPAAETREASAPAQEAPARAVGGAN